MAKILHVISGLNDGGAEGALYRLCLNDDANIHRVVSMMDDGKYGARLRALGIHVDVLNMRRGRISLSGLVRLWRILRAYDPDVVQTWLYHADLIGGVIGRLAGIDAVCWGVRAGASEDNKARGSTAFVRRLCARLSRYVPKLIISCSHDAALAHKRLGYSGDRFVVVANGYDLAQFQPDEAARIGVRAELGLAEDTPLIGMVARYDPDKDHLNLIRALGEAARMGYRFECLLIGSGMDGENGFLREAIRSAQLENKVRLLGRRDDIPMVMNAIDIHVLSSLNEAFPNVLAEAMACGTPCVTTDVGDASFIVGDTGWICPSRNSGELAKRIGEALDSMKSPEAWSARRLEARRRISEEFDIRRMVAGFRDAWEWIIEARVKAGGRV